MDWAKIIPAILSALIAVVGAWTGVRVEISVIAADLAALKTSVQRLEARTDGISGLERHLSVVQYRLDRLEGGHEGNQSP